MRLCISILILIQILPAQVLTSLDQVGVAGFQHARSISDIKTLSDGKHILSSSRDNTVRLWEIGTGKEIRSFTHENFDDIWGLCILPGEKEILCAADFGKGGAVVRYNIATGEQLAVYHHSETAFRIDAHPNKNCFVAGDGAKLIKLWDLETGNCIRDFTGHAGDVYSVIFNADGSRLISGCDEGQLKMWDTETGECLRTSEQKFEEVYTVSPSPDYQKIAVVSDDQHIRILNAKTFKILWEKKLNAEGQVVTWSPDGKIVATASHDETLFLFNSEDGIILQSIPTEQDHTPVAFSTDGSLFISGGENHLHLHSVETGERLHPSLGVPALSGGFEGLAITNDGRSIYAHGGSEQLVRWIRGNEKATKKTEQPHAISDLTLSRDGSLLALSDQGGTLRTFSSETGIPDKSFKTGFPITKITFGIDSNDLLIGGQMGDLERWNLDTKKRTGIFKGLTKEINDLALSANGITLISAENEGNVVFWSMNTHSQIGSKRANFKDGNGKLVSNHPRHLALLNNGNTILADINEPQLIAHLVAELEQPEVVKSEHLEELIKQLASVDFKKRDEATKELKAIGVTALPTLEKIDADDPEVTFRVRKIINLISGGGEEGDLKMIHEFNNDIYTLTADPKGRYFAATIGWSANASLIIGEIINGKAIILQTLKTGRSPDSVSFSPNGQFLATGNRNGTVDIYEVTR